MNDRFEEVVRLVEGNDLVRLDRMMESFRYGQYDFESSVGEIVDNAVEAGAKRIWVLTATETDTQGRKEVEVISEVAVVDDGCGMSIDVLGRALILGESARSTKPNGGRGIGRFGVGLTMGGIAVARRIEIYSRERKGEPFLWTYLDLDEIRDKVQKKIPVPQPKAPDARYGSLLRESTGTIVLLTKCDRLQREDTHTNRATPGSELVKSLPTYLGRTYRKFIDAGLEIYLNCNQIYLHDPLYMMMPTRFPGDLTATEVGREYIELPVPDNSSRTAKVEIVMSLLPKEWRKYKGAGGSTFADERKIKDNEGISILRAGREVLYGPVPFLLGERGRAKYEDIDRWWGCEISFPPELDDYFHVKYIKRGAEPVPALRQQIRTKISRTVDSLRKQIQEDFAKTSEAKAKEKGIFHEAEAIMELVDRLAPKGKRGADMTPAEKDQTIAEVVRESVASSGYSTEEKKRELASKPYSIEPVSYPATHFFETVHALGTIIIKLNINHPFYQHIFEPLCGKLSDDETEAQILDASLSTEQRKIRNALMLLLLSYAKAESFIEHHDEMLESLRLQWGVTLKTVLTKMINEG